MRYRSTRGLAPLLPFDGVLRAGLATDGGLYVPETFPLLSPEEHEKLAEAPFHRILAHILRAFIGTQTLEQLQLDLESLCSEAMDSFPRENPLPMVRLSDRDWLLEQFHGPTLSFKDIALQTLARLLDGVLERQDAQTLILGATSGDTGSAAMAACRGRKRIRMVMLYPQGRISTVQRRQMTCLAGDRVRAVAIKGTFDDCQRLVKTVFARQEFRETYQLGAVNSINWARIATQAACYFHAFRHLDAPAAAFCVPSGNFGNLYAGYVAQRMGLPIRHLIAVSNRNDLLARFFQSNDLAPRQVTPTISPAIDIQVPSNLERLFFELLDGDGEAVRDALAAHALPGAAWQRTRPLFAGLRCNEEDTRATLRRMFQQENRILDPHTGVGLHGATRARAQGLVPEACPLVTLATAHPAKFPEAVEAACGVPPPVPDSLAAMMAGPERQDDCDADADALMHRIGEWFGGP